jgi:hypothetical protein
MIRLEAESIGEGSLVLLTNPMFRGLTHSVFRNAINILSANQELVTILAIPDRAPWAVNVPGTRLDSFAIRPQDGVSVEEKILVIGSQIVIDFHRADSWRMPGLDCHHARPSTNSILENLDSISSILAEKGPREGFGDFVNRETWELTKGRANAFARFAKPYADRLVEGIVDGRIDMIQESSAPLVGLGIGSTPSGDDFLSGLMLGFRYATQHISGGANAFAKLVCETILRVVEGQTNPISENQIRYAAHGLTAKSIFGLVAALLGHEEGLIPRAKEVMEKGATSGEDITVGIVRGIYAAVLQKDIDGLPTSNASPKTSYKEATV